MSGGVEPGRRPGSAISVAQTRGQKGICPVGQPKRHVGPESLAGVAGPLTSNAAATDMRFREGRAGSASGPLSVVVAPSKYRNVRTAGYASAREAKRAAELQLLERAGAIRNLREQVRFELIPAQEGERACDYIADFVYEDEPCFAVGALSGWHLVVEDCKGVRTREYVIKRKLMLWIHKIKVRET